MEDHESKKGKTESLILSKKDEQERVQRKTFTNWINTYLNQAHPPYKIENISESIKDGLCLIHLLEVMTGEKLKKEQPKHMQRIHCLANINSALDFLKRRKIKLVNINATDIADGKPSIILGLMWTIILFFQIEEQEEILVGALGPDFDGKVNAKAALLNWVNKTLGDKYDLNVTDFGPSWRDGKAFNALVHNIDPDLIDWDEVQRKTNIENLQEAFKQAEQLGIPHILDVQDVDVEKPDEKSIMTYITQFLKSYPDGGKEIEEKISATNKKKEEAALKAFEEEQEKLRLAEEKRLREEAERKQKLEEERKRREEAERKRREEEERKRKEEEERKRREEEERRRREEEERKRREEEERKRKEEEERKRREEAERKRREEEERKRKEEEERKRREEAEKKRREEEERKRKEEAERKRKEEEERQKKLAAEAEQRKNAKDQLDSVAKWIKDLNSFLDDGLDCDDDSIGNYLENLEGLLSDKDLIDEDLSSLKDDIKSGACGLDYIKPLLNDIQGFEKQLKESISKASNVKNALYQNRDQLKCCEKNMNDVVDWIANLDKAMEEVNETITPDQCEQRLNKFKNHLHSESKAQGALKEIQDIYSKLKNSSPKNLKDSALIRKIQDIESSLKEKTDKGKALDKSLNDLDKSLSKANDWQKEYEKRMNNIGSLSNDVSKLKQQLEKIENLKKLQGDGVKVIQDVIEKGQTALNFANDMEPVQKKINLDLENLENRWFNNTNHVNSLEDEIRDKLSKVESVMQSGNKVESWLREKENDFKANRSTCDTLPQKIEKISNLQKLLNEIESESPIIEDYLSQLEQIANTDPNSLKKLNQTKQQLNNLQKNLKDAIKEAEDHASNHENFERKLDTAGEWLERAKAMKLEAMNKDSPGSIEELKRRKEIIEKLVESKNNGECLVKAAVASGEMVAKETSSKGKEEILSGVRSLNRDFLDLLDGLGAARQAIEMKLTKASNINRDLDGLVHWADEFEKKLDNVTDTDLEKIKVLCDDAQAKMFLADNLHNQTKSMNDPELQDQAEQIKGLVKHNLENAQHMQASIKENTQMFNGLLNSCKNMDAWINDSEKKMMRYGESLRPNPEELNNNLKSLEKLSSDVRAKRSDLEKINNQGRDLAISSPSRAKEINEVLEHVNQKYEKLLNDLDEKNECFRNNIEDQKEFDEAMHKAQQWLNDATQKLLKYSDIKQCTPSMIDAFSKKFESLLDSFPYGEESINAALFVGQKHLNHLKDSKAQGLNYFDRDSKRINEIEKNWNDFKKQIDQVKKNVQRVKDNLNEFNILEQKLERNISDKESNMKNHLPIESLKDIVSDIEEAANDLDKLQSKATEVSGSLNFPSAISVAKGIVDRYHNLKRNVEAELNKAKQLENDWTAYKNAVNACEKWIVDTGFRIIENDYGAYSPEDAQAKLDEFSKIHDQISNFTQEVNKIIKMGKQLSSKISEYQKSQTDPVSFTQHSESEIETDIDNLQSSHKNLLENANQTKSRLQEQLQNWRKYRDLVQVNDKYLTNDVTDWWSEKKNSPPQTSKDIDRDIQEAEGILKNLTDRQIEMQMSKSNCQSLSLENGPRDFSVTAESDRKRKISQITPLSRLAESVETGFEKNIEEIKKFIPHLENLLQNLQNFDKETEELEHWVKEKEQIYDSEIGQPSLKKSSLSDKQRQTAEQLKKDIEGHERIINDLLEKAQAVGSRKINPLLKRVEDLKRQLKRLLDRKDEEIDAMNFDYVDKQTVACQNSGVQNNLFENISTQTLPEKCNISTSTDSRPKKTKVQNVKQEFILPVTRDNIFGMRNSGGNRGISKMLYPYCCTSDLLNQKLHLDYIHGSRLRSPKPSPVSNVTMRIRNGDFPPRRDGLSKVRSQAEESVRRNWMSQDLS